MKRNDSTNQLIADAEALVGRRPTRPTYYPTQELLTEAEGLVGRPLPRPWGRWAVLGGLITLVGAASALWLT